MLHCTIWYYSLYNKYHDNEGKSNLQQSDIKREQQTQFVCLVNRYNNTQCIDTAAI